MSLIQTISSRILDDCINEGSKMAFTGTATNTQTDTVIWDFPATRSCIVVGYVFTTSSATALQVSLGFKPNDGATVNFFTGFIAAGGGVERVFQVGDWYRSPLDTQLVIAVAGTGTIAYTIDCRNTSSPAAVGYPSREGAIDHDGRAVLAPESGKTRGLSEL